MTSLTGGCACGSITYRVTEPLQDARSCHCSRCRKVFSAQASAYALVAPGSFEWTAGEDMLTSFVSEAGEGLCFCSRCGSTLAGIVDGKVHGVTLGCLDDADPGVRLERHIFVGSRAAWEPMPQGAPCYDEHAPEDG
jgi:hypothetical protein